MKKKFTVSFKFWVAWFWPIVGSCVEDSLLNAINFLKNVSESFLWWLKSQIGSR